MQLTPFRDAGTGDSGERNQQGGASSTIVMPSTDEVKIETPKIPETQDRNLFQTKPLNPKQRAEASEVRLPARTA